MMKNKCSLWYCYQKGKHGLQVEIAGIKQVVAWYCDKHAKIADEFFKTNQIETKTKNIKYTPLCNTQHENLKPCS